MADDKSGAFLRNHEWGLLFHNNVYVTHHTLPPQCTMLHYFNFLFSIMVLFSSFDFFIFTTFLYLIGLKWENIKITGQKMYIMQICVVYVMDQFFDTFMYINQGQSIMQAQIQTTYVCTPRQVGTNIIGKHIYSKGQNLDLGISSLLAIYIIHYIAPSQDICSQFCYYCMQFFRKLCFLIVSQQAIMESLGSFKTKLTDGSQYVGILQTMMAKSVARNDLHT